MVSIHGLFFGSLDLFWRNLRHFAYENQSFFELLFVVFYSVEQMILLVLTFYLRDSEVLSLVISFFALVVLAIFSCQKTLMESRIRIQEAQITNLSYEKRFLEEKADLIVEGYESLKDRSGELSQHLNILESTKNQRGNNDQRGV